MSRWPKGKEPSCPSCNTNKLSQRESRQCVECSRNPGWHLPRPDVVPEQRVVIQSTPLSDDLLKALKKGASGLVDLAEACRVTPGQALDGLITLKAKGVNIHQFGEQWSLEKAPEIGSSDVSVYTSRPDGTYRFGWLGDTHLCSKYERLDVLNDLYRRFAEEDIDRIFHAGNWIDGEARFNKFDLKVHGMDAQIRYLRDNYPVAPHGIKTFSVAGDDHEGWYCQREGVDIGKYAESAMREGGRADWVNLGYMEAFVPLRHAKTGKMNHLHLVHPGGGSAYATSYTVQKLVESYSGGSKPAVLLAGHYHKLEFINIRNVWAIQTGCTQDQTPFARKKRLHYSLGGGICELEQDPETGAIIGCTVQMWHYFDKGYYNNRWSMSGDVALPDRSVHP